MNTALLDHNAKVGTLTYKSGDTTKSFFGVFVREGDKVYARMHEVIDAPWFVACRLYEVTNFQPLTQENN